MIQQEKVLQFLLYDLKIAPDIAELLSNILTYNKHLPTGSPSSQILTYWAYRQTMRKIYEKACELGIKMTLFVDDLTFSSSKPIPEAFKTFVKGRLEKEGLTINKKKSKSYNSNKYKKVTGTVISPNNKLLVPNKLQHKIYLLKNKKQKSNKEILSLKGMLNSARQIQPKFMDNYYKELMK